MLNKVFAHSWGKIFFFLGGGWGYREREREREWLEVGRVCLG